MKSKVRLLVSARLASRSLITILGRCLLGKQPIRLVFFTNSWTILILPLKTVGVLIRKDFVRNVRPVSGFTPTPNKLMIS